MKMRWSQWKLQFKQLQINPRKNFGTSTGFESMASAFALQCSNQLSYEDPYIGRRPICWVHLNPWKWNTKWWCDLRKYKFKWRYHRHRVNLQLLKLQFPLRRSYLHLNLYLRSSHHHSVRSHPWIGMRSFSWGLATFLLCNLSPHNADEVWVMRTKYSFRFIFFRSKFLIFLSLNCHC